MEDGAATAGRLGSLPCDFENSGSRNEEQMEACIAELAGRSAAPARHGIRGRACSDAPSTVGDGSPTVVCRAAGDRHLLIEYGPNVLDLNLRSRVHALRERLRAAILPGILDITPGVRSLQVPYDGRVLSREIYSKALEACEEQIPDLNNLVLPSRVVRFAALLG